MELHLLIEAVKAAADKGELEALVLKEVGLNLDKRKGLETLRAEVLAGLEGAAEPVAPEAPVPEPVTHGAEKAELPAAELVAQDPTTIEAPAQVLQVSALVELPELEDEPEAPAPKPKQRLLRHKSNGRLLVWTPALAGLTELEEV